MELKNICIERMKPFQCEGFVTSSGPIRPDIMFIGEAPGATEVEKNISFSGRAGEKLMEFINYLGYSRKDVFITSTIRSRSFKIIEKKDSSGNLIQKKVNRTPTKNEIIAHAPILDYYIENVNPKIIVTLGNIAYKRVTGEREKLTDVHGIIKKRRVCILKDFQSTQYVFGEKEYYVMSTFHPASVFYNSKLLNEIYSDLDNLKKFLKK